MPQTFSCLRYHIIFSTKNREPQLTDDVRPRLYEYVGGLLRAEKGVLLAAGGMPDHAHWLVSLHPTMSVAEAVRIVKAVSSKWIHESFAALRSFAWQAGYGAFTVSDSQLPQVTRYLERQQDHHRTLSFHDEFLAFLERHRIPYDERHLWD